MWDTCTSPLGPRKFDWVGRGRGGGREGQNTAQNGIILVVQPSGRLVNSLDRIDGGLLQWMDSRFLWAPVRFGQGNPKCIEIATVSTQRGSSSGIN